MSDANATTKKQPDQKQSQGSINSDAHIDVDVEDLIVGRELHFPILDPAGLLLLSEGTTISAEFKAKLLDRNMGKVRLHKDDANVLTFRIDQPHVEMHEPASPLDDAISENLQQAITSGLPFVTNNGPAVRNQMQHKQCEAYDAAQAEALTEEHQKNLDQMKTMMTETSEGEAIDGKQTLEIAQRYLKQMTDDIGCFSASQTLITKDRSLARHALGMSVLAMGMAAEMGLNADNVSKIGVTAMLHDWGMLKVPQHLRDPEHELTELELFEIKKHPMHSVNLLENAVGLPALVSLLSYQVHERLDGSGYPRGRTEQSIHLFARILNVAHEYIDLTSPKKYRPAYAPYTAMEMLLSPQSTQYSTQYSTQCHDPLMVRVLLRMHSLFPVGSFVALSDGSAAKVIRANGDLYTQPIVQVVQTSKGEEIASSNTILNLQDDSRSIVQALRTPGTKEILTKPTLVSPTVATSPRTEPRTEIKTVTGPHFSSTRRTRTSRTNSRPTRRRVIRQS